MECIFCKIVDKKLDSTIVYEDDQIMAFLDVQPINKGHTLVIPKKHSENFLEMPENLVAKLMIVAQKVANNLKNNSEINCQGVSTFINSGSCAGQVVFHTHIHVLPRFENDNFYFGRKS